jgi:tRNA1(Val) A37 N6-methylase TrmN6
MLKKKFPQWNITGIEIDLEQAKLAKYNSALQSTKINVIKGDFRSFLSEEKYDLIIANPPYQKVGFGRQSPYLRTNLAKFELTCKMENVFIALKQNLSVNGEAWLLYAQDREDDLIKNIDEGMFKIILMIRKNKIVIVGLKYVAS